MKARAISTTWRAILGFAAILAIAIGHQVHTYRRGAELVAACGQSLEIGESDAEVSKALGVGACAKLTRSRIKQDEHDVELLQSQIVFGAPNWVLYVELAHERVTAIRARTADSRAVRPASAPQDREADTPL